MSNVNIAITQKMVNIYHLYQKTPTATKDNLYKLWEEELGQELDITQRKWLEDCMTGKRAMTFNSRHGRSWVAQNQVMKPTADIKGLTSTLNELPKAEYQAIHKGLTE